MQNGSELLAEHYQKTFEVTLSFWEQRNRIFLILLFVVATGAFLTFKVSQAEPLLVDYVAHLIGIENKDRIAELRSSFPYGLIQSIILMVILYLMVQLYHRTITITRNYEYLSCVEQEIRDRLELQFFSVSFTREGSFYWGHTSALSKWIGVAYILMLGILLVAFLVMRLYGDFCFGNIAVIVSDIFLSLTILIFFVAYSYSSSSVVRSFFRRK